MKRRRPVNLRGERMRDAYPELARLLMRRPARSRPWRDFWKVWLPSFALTMLTFIVLGTDPFSLPGLAILVAGLLVTMIIGQVFQRWGIIGEPPARPLPPS